jgi:RHS repeat-associated protein
VSATDGANNTVTNNYQVAANNGTALSWIYDANGNFSYGPNEGYSFDPENRLQYIDFYTPNTPRTEYDHDALGRCVAITVYSSFGVISSQKIYVWSGGQMIQEQDASGNVTKDFYSQGENRAGTNYFYTKDHLASIRELTDYGGNIQAQYRYDPYGQATKIQGLLDCDFQYAGYFYEPTSGFNLNRYRNYSPNLGRWISRDPLEDEENDSNLFDYVKNNPIGFYDPTGLAAQGFSQAPLSNVGSIMAGGAPPPPDPTGGRPKIFNQGDNPCEGLQNKMQEIVDELAKRLKQDRKGKKKIPEKKCDVKKKAPGSREGHKEQYDNKKSQLQDLIRAWFNYNCGPLPEGVQDSADTPFPYSP